jgi:hypothetical protein
MPLAKMTGMLSLPRQRAALALDVWESAEGADGDASRDCPPLHAEMTIDITAAIPSAR